MSQSGADGSIDVTFDNDVAIISMNRGENRINVDFVEKMNEALDQVEKNEEVEVLVLTAVGKYFSLGMDLEYFKTSGKPQSGARVFDNIVLRLLTFPIVTVAAINGHAFAGGMFIALACDIRVMCGDKGWLCLNEARIGIPFTSEYFRILFGLLLPSPQVVKEAAFLAKIYTAQDALKAGILQAVLPRSDLIQGAVMHGRSFLMPGDKYKLDRKIMRANKEFNCKPLKALIGEHLEELQKRLMEAIVNSKL